MENHNNNNGHGPGPLALNPMQVGENKYLEHQQPKVEYPYAQGPFEDRSYGRHGQCEIGYSRTISPEYVLGDYPEDSDPWYQLRSRLLHPFISYRGDMTIERADYNSIGPVGQGMAAAMLTAGLGRNDQTIYPMVADPANPNTFVAGNSALAGGVDFSTPNLILGVVIDWGISMLNWSPFSLQFRTEEFVGGTEGPGGAQDLNRSMLCYVDSKTSNGTSIYLPFAQRVSGTTADPSGSILPAGSGTGGMTNAIIQPATLQSPDIEAGGISIVRVGPIPGALVAAFQATVRLICAGSPALAMYSRLEGLFDNDPVRGARHSHYGANYGG